MSEEDSFVTTSDEEYDEATALATFAERVQEIIYCLVETHKKDSAIATAIKDLMRDAVFDANFKREKKLSEMRNRFDSMIQTMNENGNFLRVACWFDARSRSLWVFMCLICLFCSPIPSSGVQEDAPKAFREEANVVRDRLQFLYDSGDIKSARMAIDLRCELERMLGIFELDWDDKMRAEAMQLSNAMATN